MTEEEARRFLLIRAIESEDQDGAFLTADDRRDAAAAASGAAVHPGKYNADEPFLAQRSGFAFQRLAARYPAVRRADAAVRWPSWLGWALPLLGFVIGLGTNELHSGKQLNLIAFPLMGLIAWNLGVYLMLAVQAARAALSSSSPGRLPIIFKLATRAGAGLHSSQSQPQLARALSRFASDWLRVGGRLHASRAQRVLHLSAAATALGLIGGMYLRALSVEYRAGWESTFIDAHALEALLSVTLGPASFVSGIILPGVERLADLQWSSGRGERAGSWIHLFSLTAFLFIIVPRLLLAGAAGLTSARLRRRLSVDQGDPYVRRLLRAASGRSASVRVIPYSFSVSSERAESLSALLRSALGESAAIELQETIAYGAEDEWLAASASLNNEDYLAVLFNLSSTPEAENHGELLVQLGRRVASSATGTHLVALVDESSYRKRLATQAGGEARLAERRRAWQRELSNAAVPMVFVDLEAEADARVIGELEAKFTTTAPPESGAIS